MFTYGAVILFSWAAFIIVWMVAAFGIKRDIRGGGITGLWYRFFLLRLVGVALVVFVVWRVVTGTAHYSKATAVLAHNALFTPPAVVGWIGAALAVLGVAFAVWARFHLGTNWSPVPAVKENHELVTSGPYRYVRHPIYTGVILAAFGAALTGTIFGMGIFLVVSVMFFLRISKEEEIMLELFPGAYPAYQARTKKLIPFVW
ncbi:MAG TPA: isoprenylcysteine carboxylmethyltransferase family protein [Candidatus Paceibacterota bacterium]|nr:isoprenylcysteine carboxylmethyltransferase family protein [Candidatus Paceibacterota bacterium]